MNDPRPYASLSSGLLARKGMAKPAMRPQGYGQGLGNLEDLGWNDMGQAPGEQPQPPAAPAPEHVPSSIAALTPAPRIQRTNPGAAHLPPPDGEEYDYGEDEEALEAEGEGAGEYHGAPETAEFDQPAGTEPFGPPPAETAHFDPPSIEAEPSEAPLEAPPVVAQQRAILERFDAGEELPAMPAAAVNPADIVPLPARVTSGDRRKAAFTLRLDAERHLRLRLACAVTRRSAQQIVVRALDEALANIPEIEALASQVPAKPGRAGKS